MAFAAIQELAERLDEWVEELAEKSKRIDDLESESEWKDERIEAQWERIDDLDRVNEQVRERLATVEDRLPDL